MTDKLRDKLSRVSALRPVSDWWPAGRALRSSVRQDGRLTELLGAECRSNTLGRHLLLRRWFADPQPPEISARALGRILPNASENALDPERWLFLDTETTGLAGGTGTYAFMVGLAWWENGGFTVEQYFMRDYNEEPSLLLGLTERLAEKPVLVTFNGKSFDWPLLQTRYRITRVTHLEEPEAHLDLLHPARQLWSLRLKSVALSVLEQYVLGQERAFDIPSATIPTRYFEFLRGGPPDPIVEVFHHNQMDLRGLASLAAHIAGIMHEPESAQCHAEDLFGMSRLLQRRGEGDLAGQIYQRALEGGLPEIVERKAQRELALIAKRRHDFQRSNDLWEQLLGDSSEGLLAYEQLAIYYEHHAREPERAASLTREALVRLREALHAGRLSVGQYQQWHTSLQYRLNRLLSKASVRS
ncbi:MAG TPA: ribonuclease H-like domain-containing protein [Acidobacteriota bacterium]|nr:ribonuclease H-like domain-containing protein [Acidobacteriota bacterium]